MIANNSLKKGRSAEYFVASQLLKYDCEVYFPAVDVVGVDLLLRNPKGTIIELQVKARRVFKQTETFIIRDFPERPCYFMCFFDLRTNNYYIVPSSLVRSCRKIVGKQTWYVIDWNFLQSVGEYKNTLGLHLLLI